ncbi:MAG: putative collagen-binding domain-containing protein, partial [Ginsengibacter sp.]
QYKHVYTMLYEEMLNRYRMPCILIESAYERERHTTAQTIRRQVYWALLSGASGEVFGHRDTYTVGAKRNSALNDPGVESMGIFQTFTGTIPWHKMKGDWPHSLFITGRGNFNATQYPGGEDYATAAFTTDSTLAVLYMPSYRKAGVNMNRFKNAVTVKWFDPSSGVYTTVAGNFLNKGVRYFTPPSFNNAKGFDDWVLIIKTIE